MRNILTLTIVMHLSGVSLASTQEIGGGIDVFHQWDGQGISGSFGYSVSGARDINLDGVPDIIVGAYQEEVGGNSNVGSASVFSGVDGSLLHQWVGEGTDDNFGNSVSWAGDVNGDGIPDVIVGAHQANFTKINSGSAYVFSGADGSLIFRLDGGNESDHFGKAVSGVGDVDGDGLDDVLVAAHAANPAGKVDAGSVYLFSGADESLIFRWDGEAENDFFGNSVSGAGDFDGDNIQDIIIGAPQADPGGASEAGKMYVFSGADGSPLFQRDGDNAGDHFGFSVTNAGDFDQDGFAEVMVGASQADPSNLLNAGSAYAFSGPAGSLLYRWDGTSFAGQFGRSVSGAGDMDGDGYEDFLVGEPFSSPNGLALAGSAYIFSSINGDLLFRVDGDVSDDHFGTSVAVVGDTDEDGRAEIVLGAFNADPGGMQGAGSAYLFGFSPFLTSEQESFSSATGAILGYQLDFPKSAAFENYKILLSVSGPGSFHFGVEIPLTLDAQVVQTYYGNYPFQFSSHLQGTLDANGAAYTTIGVLPGSVGNLIGNTFHLAAIAFAQSGPPNASSVAVPITIDP